METSILLAKIIGPVYLVASLTLLLNQDRMIKMVKTMKEQDFLMYSMGAFTLILGLLLVNIHNIWEASYLGLITFIGWGATVKGAMLMVCPDTMAKFSNYFANKTALRIGVVVTLILGLYLTNIGYFM